MHDFYPTKAYWGRYNYEDSETGETDFSFIDDMQDVGKQGAKNRLEKAMQEELEKIIRDRPSTKECYDL